MINHGDTASTIADRTLGLLLCNSPDSTFCQLPRSDQASINSQRSGWLITTGRREKTSLIGVFRALVEALNAISTNILALACIGMALIVYSPVAASGLITGAFALLSHRPHP
jgi:hypothetical protein